MANTKTPGPSLAIKLMEKTLDDIMQAMRAALRSGKNPKGLTVKLLQHERIKVSNAIAAMRGGIDR